VTFRPGTAALSRGVVLPYVEHGDADGVPVVFLHAYADSWRSFEHVLLSLPPWIRAVAVSQRGHGDATKPVSGYGVADFVDDVVTFLAVLALDRAILVASSSAGFTARHLAVTHPELVTGVVLIGVPWSLRERAPSLAFVDAVANLEDPVNPVFVRDFVGGTSSERVPPTFLDAMVEESLKVPAHVWKQTLDGLLDAPPVDADSIVAPALVIWGERDVLVPREDQELLLAEARGSRLLVYGGAGHIPHWETPDRVAADIASFADEIGR
jgi:pimeloyl-ACP methyl ester carboxylesterase